jgi:hypothetical protein
MEFPEPVISVAIEPKTKVDQDKLGKALGALGEDPTFQVRTDDETGQTIIAGMGELHLDVLVDRMIREFSVAANVGKPQVAYRETITDPGREGRGALRPPDRRSGPVRPRGHQPRAHRARWRLRVRRQDRRRRDPARVHPRGRRRHAGGARGRRRRGYPLVDVRAILTFGSYHDVDSSEMAFKIAGSMALKKAAAGQARAARADHAGRGRHARGLHGRRHRRPVVAARQVEGMEQRGTATSCARKCRSARCSATLPTSVRAPRARDVHDAVRLVPAGAGVDRRGDRTRVRGE